MIFGNLADPQSEIRQVLGARFSIRRKPELGTRPNIFYMV
jgi:molybdopterin-containing oxidoreductase family iron-sulfur binding subunit